MGLPIRVGSVPGLGDAGCGSVAATPAAGLGLMGGGLPIWMDDDGWVYTFFMFLLVKNGKVWDALRLLY